MKSLLTYAVLLIISFNALSQSQIKSFTSGSYEKIVQQYQLKPFVMVLWSLDCPPCYKELELLSNKRKQQDFNLVLISVDGADSNSEVSDVLEKYKLQTADNWLFNEHVSQQLRYEIDPLWYGELPRSYLFNKQHQRQAISGVLKTSQLPK